MRIETERAFSSILLAEREPELSPSDRALCHNIVLGVLRRKMYFDALIAHFTRSRELDTAVKVSLWIGLYQILFLDRVPTYSAVDESVRLVERAKIRSAKGFVNAVLRRAARETYVPSFEDEIERISFETSHPKWLLERWASQYGMEQARAIAEANNLEPKLAFRNTLKTGRELGSSGIRPSRFVEGAFIAEKMTDELRSAAATGEIYFQDEASQMVAGLIDLPHRGRFLDVCAAPGGKATLVVVRNRMKQPFIVAGEINTRRRRVLLENCEGQAAGRIFVVGLDAGSALPFENGVFDAVLVDAPCSGTGTIRHNPEIRYLLEPSDISELALKQRRILVNASKMVRIGGQLVYSTCSLEREENENIVEDFLRQVQGFERTRARVHERFVEPDLNARTFPHRDEMDGFFAAVLRRK